MLSGLVRSSTGRCGRPVNSAGENNPLATSVDRQHGRCDGTHILGTGWITGVAPAQFGGTDHYPNVNAGHSRSTASGDSLGRVSSGPRERSSLMHRCRAAPKRPEVRSEETSSGTWAQVSLTGTASHGRHPPGRSDRSCPTMAGRPGRPISLSPRGHACPVPVGVRQQLSVPLTGTAQSPPAPRRARDVRTLQHP